MRQTLDDLYHIYNRPAFIHPDPLEIVYRFRDPADREIAGMIASALAFGRVSQILLTLGRVFDVIGPSPSVYLNRSDHASLALDFNGFVYRFVRDRHLVDFLLGLKGLISRFGSVERAFIDGLSQDDETLVPAMDTLVRQMLDQGRDPGYLLATPSRNSACKRLNLYLRWMVRNDAVDTGTWTRVSPRRLIVPLDTHMHRIALHLGLTARRSADMKTALEITRAFAAICPEDPVKYDFSLTRFGIHPDLDSRGLMGTLGFAHPTGDTG
jgi:uncharacterized protein (TIGR02757 family)